MRIITSGTSFVKVVNREPA